MATGIKTICPNKFHNYFPTLPLLLLPYVLVRRYVYMEALHLCAYVGSEPHIHSPQVHTHTQPLHDVSAAGVGRMSPTCHCIFTSLKVLHEWPVHQPPSGCDSLRRTGPVYISETFTTSVSHFFCPNNAKDLMWPTTGNMGTGCQNMS